MTTAIVGSLYRDILRRYVEPTQAVLRTLRKLDTTMPYWQFADVIRYPRSIKGDRWREMISRILRLTHQWSSSDTSLCDEDFGRVFDEQLTRSKR